RCAASRRPAPAGSPRHPTPRSPDRAPPDRDRARGPGPTQESSSALTVGGLGSRYLAERMAKPSVPPLLRQLTTDPLGLGSAARSRCPGPADQIGRAHV